MKNMGNIEILQIIDAVSRDKGISKASLIHVMEQAVEAAGRKKYGNEHHITAKMDQKNGDIMLFRIFDVVEKVNNTFAEIALEDAMTQNPEIEIGGQILDRLPPIDLGRVAAQVVKQVIVQKVGEEERRRQYEDYKDRKGDILNGTVKRIEFGSIIVDLGRAEAILKKDQQIRGEIFKVNDRIRAYVQDIRLELKGPQIFLSRTDDKFLSKLFEMEVPEIYDNIIEIKAIAREPGSKAKMAVFAADSSIDPIGSCVGVRGSRVRSITNELAGEKIDIIAWDRNVAQFVINSMTPAEIVKIVFDEDKNRVEVVVPNDQLSVAIGRQGQNVRLASKITNWKINVLTEEQESKRRIEEFANTTELFMSVLELDELMAQLLSAEGFTNIEQIASAEDNILGSIAGLNQELVEEIKNRAINYVESQNDDIIEKLEALGVEQDLLDNLDLQPEYILKLAEYGIKTIEDLGEISSSEFRTIVPEEAISAETIEGLINFAKDRSNE